MLIKSDRWIARARQHKIHRSDWAGMLAVCSGTSGKFNTEMVCQSYRQLLQGSSRYFRPFWRSMTCLLQGDVYQFTCRRTIYRYHGMSAWIVQTGWISAIQQVSPRSATMRPHAETCVLLPAIQIGLTARSNSYENHRMTSSLNRDSVLALKSRFGARTRDSPP